MIYINNVKYIDIGEHKAYYVTLSRKNEIWFTAYYRVINNEQGDIHSVNFDPCTIANYIKLNNKKYYYDDILKHFDTLQTHIEQENNKIAIEALP